MVTRGTLLFLLANVAAWAGLQALQPHPASALDPRLALPVTRLRTFAAGWMWASAISAIYWWFAPDREVWLETSGTVEQHIFSDEGHPRAGLLYSYSVNGEVYSGEKWTKMIWAGQDERFSAQFPIGKTIAVRYDPSHPDISSAED